MIQHLAQPVPVSAPMRPELNRYRLKCGHFVDCQCRHPIGAHVWCLDCAELRQVTTSAVRFGRQVVVRVPEREHEP